MDDATSVTLRFSGGGSLTFQDGAVVRTVRRGVPFATSTATAALLLATTEGLDAVDEAPGADESAVPVHAPTIGDLRARAGTLGLTQFSHMGPDELAAAIAEAEGTSLPRGAAAGDGGATLADLRARARELGLTVPARAPKAAFEAAVAAEDARLAAESDPGAASEGGTDGPADDQGADAPGEAVAPTDGFGPITLDDLPASAVLAPGAGGA